MATHPEHETAPERVRRYVRFGASPRGAQALVLAAKAAALLDGRPNVAVDDLRAMAPAALRHRLVLGYEATADGVTADELVADGPRRRPRPAGRAPGRAVSARSGTSAASAASSRRAAARSRAAGPARAAAARDPAAAGRPRAGEHRSRRHGSSLDFADYREYHPGDDFRRIDYGAWARLDVLLVQLFEAEDDLTLRLLVDTSASMAGAKLRQAARLAAALGFVALVRRDVVTVHTFPLDRPAPRFTGRSATAALFAPPRPRSRPTARPDSPHAVSDLLARPGPRGLTVVLSDLLTPEWDDGLERLPARGDDVAVVHVLDRRSCTRRSPATSTSSTARPARSVVGQPGRRRASPAYERDGRGLGRRRRAAGPVGPAPRTSASSPTTTSSRSCSAPGAGPAS